MAIEWIDVSQRVPNDRREVLVWGMAGIVIGGYRPLKPRFLGATRFNPSADGGRFDIEKTGYCHICIVSHWSEIEGPKD